MSGTAYIPRHPVPITRDAAARRLGLDQVCDDPDQAVRKLIRRGDLRGIRLAGRTLVDPASVDELLDRLLVDDA